MVVVITNFVPREVQSVKFYDLDMNHQPPEFYWTIGYTAMVAVNGEGS